MIIELAHHDVDTREAELKNIIINGIKSQPDYISVFSHYIKFAKKTINGSSKICCPIDYPLGISDLKSRQTEITTAIKNGANKVDVLIPNLYLVNRKYDKLKEDISANLDICGSSDIEIFYILEYRIFNHIMLTKICNIIKEHGVQCVYASSGHMLDDISDNSIASMYLAKKTGIKTIINGNIWHKQQMETTTNYKPYGIRFKNIHSLQLWHDYQTQKK